MIHIQWIQFKLQATKIEQKIEVIYNINSNDSKEINLGINLNALIDYIRINMPNYRKANRFVAETVLEYPKGYSKK